MIKVLSGTFKGRKLTNINADILRPTQAIVRKSIMDSIRVFNNKLVLDLFSGVGTLGIEALSRGAKRVKFVEQNLKVIEILKKNINILDISNKTEIIKADVIKFLNLESDQYDLIFADPPYQEYDFNELFPLIRSLLKKNGIFCYESNKSMKLNNMEIKFRIKQYGNTQVVFWENV